jgi:hypothetical protein
MAGMISLISSKPTEYRPGKFRVAVLETFLAGVYEQVEQIKKNALSVQQMLKLAYDYESSAIISRPYEIVESQNPQFVQFRRQFAEELAEHTNRLKQLIGQKLGLDNKSSHMHLQEPKSPVTESW